MALLWFQVAVLVATPFMAWVASKLISRTALAVFLSKKGLKTSVFNHFEQDPRHEWRGN